MVVIFSSPVSENTGFLHNDYSAIEFLGFSMVIDGVPYRSVQHYYQSAKHTGEYAQLIRDTRAPAHARILGRMETIEDSMRARPTVNWANDSRLEIDALVKRADRSHFNAADWDARRVDVMRKGIIAKFRQNPTLGKKLMATGSDSIIYLERPIYGPDHIYFWGAKRGEDGQFEGSNILGALLIEVRSELKRGQ